MMYSDHRIIRLLETDSTNEYAKRLAREGACHNTVVVARKQSAGKGRLGRNFNSEEDKGIFMSLILRPDMKPVEASRLTLVAAVAVREALAELCGIQCGIKWPNDIVADGKKLCGILTEMSTENGIVKYVIVGIGVNVANEKFKEELSQVATSVFLLTGRLYDKEELMNQILRRYDKYYKLYAQTKNLLSVKSDYDSYLVNIDSRVRVIDNMGNGAVLEGICRGIDEEGDLLVEIEAKNGSTSLEKIVSGEVSVRGVYGYV